MTTPDPVSEHGQSSNHREAVLASSVVGCFYCCRVYVPAEIAEWVHEDAAGIGSTALCPRCGIDAVIPARDGVDVAFLEAMHRHWFGGLRPERLEATVADYVSERATKALASLPADQRADTYVVSFFVYDFEDDPRRPTLTIGTNTEGQLAAMVDAASDAAEARWNYSFWLQNELARVGGPLDPHGEGLVRAAFEAAGLSFADDDYSDEALATGDAMTRRFVDECVKAVQRMHETGAVVATFGRPIPVLVHELEYYDEIVEQNRRANPPRLIDEFAAWVEAF